MHTKHSINSGYLDNNDTKRYKVVIEMIVDSLQPSRAICPLVSPTDAGLFVVVNAVDRLVDAFCVVRSVVSVTGVDLLPVVADVGCVLASV